MAQTQTVSISIDDLRVGATCSYPVEGDAGVLLLGARTRISAQVISGLRERGIDSIEVHPSDLASLRGESKRKPAANRHKRAAGRGGQWMPCRPVKDLLVDRHDEDLSSERTQRLKRGMGVAKTQFDELQKLLSGDPLRSVNDLAAVSDVYARAMVDDHDQTVGVLGASTTISDLAERSVRMSVIGMAVGIELGLDGPQTLEIGMAGLLHDVGIYSMDPKFILHNEPLSESDLWEYQKHPIISLKCIQEAMEVPYSVQLTVQQVHEQFDGTGYPRGNKGQRIHLYARILNVIDAYLQLTSPAAERRAIVPHDALGLILHQAGKGMFDPQVIRAFLNTETMFPLGSMVELKNGELAQVIRRPKKGFAAPVLMGSDGERIDLASTDLEIARPVCDPHTDQMRLTNQMMQDARWCPVHHTFLLQGA